jgi:hypothetical protein
MTKVQELEQEVRKLAPSELADFRRWFQDYDSDQWDSQIEEDAMTGKLDRLAQKALADHKAGKTSEI